LEKYANKARVTLRNAGIIPAVSEELAAFRKDLLKYGNKTPTISLKRAEALLKSVMSDNRTSNRFKKKKNKLESDSDDDEQEQFLPAPLTYLDYYYPSETQDIVPSNIDHENLQQPEVYQDEIIPEDNILDLLEYESETVTKSLEQEIIRRGIDVSDIHFSAVSSLFPAVPLTGFKGFNSSPKEKSASTLPVDTVPAEKEKESQEENEHKDNLSDSGTNEKEIEESQLFDER